MVAIALVLVLMLGVSQVFKVAGNTVGANQAVSENMRNARAAQTVLAQDFGAAVTTDAPFMILKSLATPAFRNRPDDLSDMHQVKFKGIGVNGDILSLDANGNNVEGEDGVPGERVSVATYNSRNHRTDIFSFFARGLFHRQTGNDGTYAVDQTTSEAWIKYGFLRLYNGSGNLSTWTNYSDVGSLPSNFYATQWVLGRNVLLLSGGTTQNTDGYAASIVVNGTAQNFIRRNVVGNPSNLSPLADTSSAATGEVVTESRYDLAGITIDQARSLVGNYINQADRGVAGYDLTGNNSWFSQLGYPFWSNPKINKPMTSEDMARCSPAFLAGCTQFIVEYAGDYLKQNVDSTDTSAGGAGDAAGVYGAMHDTYVRYDSSITNDPVTGNPLPPTSGLRYVTGQTDGVIDFVVINGQRQIRWYGMPRDTDGDGRASLVTAGGMPSGDVIPLRDVWQYSPWNTPASQSQLGRNAPFEKNWPTPKINYADTTGIGNLGMGIGDEYVCAWNSNDPKPKMIRITLTLDDPAGRLAEGQTFEYVFTLP